MGAKPKVIQGKRFGRWKVLEVPYKNRKAKCVCDCGTVKWVYRNNLTGGKSVSCGCFMSESVSERMSTMAKEHKKLHNVYWSMRNRCYNSNTKSYKDYGEKGITVCGEWLESFENFCIWALNNGYEEGLTIDRIDSTGKYEPDNCRWVTMLVQNRNKSNNRLVTINGETKVLSEWSSIIGVAPVTLSRRIKKGWTDDELLFKPSWKRKEERDEYISKIN